MISKYEKTIQPTRFRALYVYKKSYNGVMF